MLVLVSAVAAWVHARAGHVGQAEAYASEASTRLDALMGAVGFSSRLRILVPTCLAEARLGLGELDSARLLHRQALDACVLEPHARMLWSPFFGADSGPSSCPHMRPCRRSRRRCSSPATR